MATFVYLVLPEVSSGIGIMLLCGVFISQILIDIYKTPVPNFGSSCQMCTCDCLRSQRQEYDRLQSYPHQNTDTSYFDQEGQSEYLYSKAGVIIENKIVKVIAFLFQLTGIAGFIVLWITKSNENNYNFYRPVFGYLFVIVVLSILWTNIFQEFIAEPRKYIKEEQEGSHELDSTPRGEESSDETYQSDSGDNNSKQENQSQAKDDIVTARFKSSRYSLL